jgi:hypothetical protein
MRKVEKCSGSFVRKFSGTNKAMLDLLSEARADVRQEIGSNLTDIERGLRQRITN